MTIRIASAAFRCILEEERAAFPHECCGLLLGGGDHVRRALPAANVAADPARCFEVDPAVLVAAHRAARGGGEAVLGHYHSHPAGPPCLSRTDAEQSAVDGALWLLVAAGEVQLWRSVAGGTLHDRFEPTPFVVA